MEKWQLTKAMGLLSMVSENHHHQKKKVMMRMMMSRKRSMHVNPYMSQSAPSSLACHDRAGEKSKCHFLLLLLLLWGSGKRISVNFLKAMASSPALAVKKGNPVAAAAATATPAHGKKQGFLKVLKTIDRWRTSGRPICPCTLQMHLIVVF
jgi:hypothetical protein